MLVQWNTEDRAMSYLIANFKTFAGKVSPKKMEKTLGMVRLTYSLTTRVQIGYRADILKQRYVCDMDFSSHQLLQDNWNIFW